MSPKDELFFVKTLLMGNPWKSQGAKLFPNAEGSYYLEAPVGSKNLDSQAVLNFKDRSLVVFPIGNW